MPTDVLVVYDSEETLSSIVEVASIYGWAISGAMSATAAFLRLQESLPHIIVIDLALRVGALALARHLKADPRTRHIPIVALTTMTSKGEDEQALIAGFDDYLKKPINPRTLHRMMERYLGPRA